MKEMTTNVKLYSSISEAMNDVILPLITPYEDEFDIVYLMDNLISSYVDGNGFTKAYGGSLLSDEERNRILRRAFQRAADKKKK